MQNGVAFCDAAQEIGSSTGCPWRERRVQPRCTDRSCSFDPFVADSFGFTSSQLCAAHDFAGRAGSEAGGGRIWRAGLHAERKLLHNQPGRRRRQDSGFGPGVHAGHTQLRWRRGSARASSSKREQFPRLLHGFTRDHLVDWPERPGWASDRRSIEHGIASQHVCGEPR